MKKTPTIFKRNPEDRRTVLRERNEECNWVFNGEGVATRKYDGTCCLVKEGKLFKRREIKKGKKAPHDFIQADHDEITGKIVGWVPVDIEAKEDQWHAEAFDGEFSDGTYELLGPKVQGNPEGYEKHILLKHSEAEIYLDAPRDYEGLSDWLEGKDIEGLVYHHPDGRMAKIKKRDFGQNRK